MPASDSNPPKPRTRHIRRLLLTLALFLITLTLWTRGIFNADVFEHYTKAYSQVFIFDCRGIHLIYAEIPPLTVSRYLHLSPGSFAISSPATGGSLLGFAFETYIILIHGPSVNPWHISIPHWFLTLTTASFFTWTLLHFLRARPTTALIPCPTCGYDLRAHAPTARCPECGTARTPIP